jgi:SAM-dependent methyltransferase
MQEDDERFLRTGNELAGLLYSNGATPDSTVLDIGCGYGRLAIGLLGRPTPHRGPYIGFDILAPHTNWCRNNITPRAPGFRFEHLDAINDRYNPKGTLSPEELRFPVEARSVDVAAAFSVFTHLYRATIEHYLDELRRVLRPGGVAVTTWLLWDDARLPAVTSDRCTYPLRYRLDADTRYSDDADPLRAIAFTPELVGRLVERAGLRLRTSTRGSWDGTTKSDVFQDLLVLEAPRRRRWAWWRRAG